MNEEENKKIEQPKYKEPTYWWVTLIIYAIELLIAAGIVILCLWVREFFNPPEYLDIMTKYRYLADAFTIPGIVYISLGFLVIVSQHGAFDGLGYALRRAGRVLLPFFFKKDQTYYEYLEERRAKQKTIRVLSIFIVGSGLLITAVIFIILFYRIYNGY